MRKPHDLPWRNCALRSVHFEHRHFRREHGKTHGVGLNDALIAATAVNRNACLHTLNVKHYPSLRKNQVVQPYRKS